MKNYETNTSIMKVLSSKLRIDSYQRPLDEKRINLILKEFNPNIVNYIKCSIRNDGELYIYDGQHTRAILERLNGNAPVIVECLVKEFVGLTDAERFNEEAKLFAQQNGGSKPVQLGSRLRAEYLAGERGATLFHEASNVSGLIMDFSKSAAMGKIVCIVEAYKAWELLGNVAYSDMLNTIVLAWDMHPASLRREVIGGLASFIKRFGSAYDTERLIKALSKVSPTQIVRDGNLSTDSGTAKYGEQVLKLYNKGIKKKLAW